jgi:glycosyltransferase involved in cell wall biosynthesis
MKISIDATTLLLRSAGVKTHLYYWLCALQGVAGARGDIVRPYPGGISLTALDHENTGMGSALAGRLRRDLVGLANIRGNPAINLLLADADLFHCSQHTANLPRRKRNTATVFDMSCWTTPQFHTLENVAATKRYGEEILKRCDGLIANSEHARRDAVEILGIPADRIRVIYPGIAESFFQTTADQAAAAREKYGLRAPYLLFVGCIEPRKNVPNMIRAYRKLPDGIRRDSELVIAGPFGWASDEVREMLGSSGPNVRYLGYVPEADLPGLTRAAAALVYPSYYEGFGLPAAQAMACGTPVIASNTSCLPEVIGEAGLLVDPDSVEELGAAMERILADSELARKLADLGRARAAAFHWADHAARSLDFFHEVAGTA